MKQSVLLAWFVALACGMQAQTLEECQRMAQEHYPEIRQYDLISRTEQYNLSNAARAWIPQVSLSAQATWQSDVPVFPDALSGMLAQQGVRLPGMHKDQYRLALDISQTIWDGGQSKANSTLAKAEAREQRERVDVDLYALRSRIDDLYFGLLLLDEQAKQTRDMTALLESNLARMRTYYNNGVAMQSDVDAVEAELLATRQTLDRMTASRESFRNMLELFIGRSLGDDAPVKPAGEEVDTRRSARPELNLFDAQSETIDARRMLVNSALSPRINAFVQGLYGYPGMNMFRSMTSTDWRWDAVVGVRMSWNIGAFYTRRNNLGKLDEARRQIDVQRDIFLFNTRLQATQDDGEIMRLRKAVANDDRIVELRRAVRMAAESGLRNGVIDAPDLLRKITEENAAAIARSTHDIELLQAVYRLKHTLNQ